MRIAFLADIHANLEALNACLADARRRRAERLVFLGDIVGYGADPGPCVDIVAEACGRGALALKGNHDEAVRQTGFELSSVAATAILWTQSVLGEAQKGFSRGAAAHDRAMDGRLYVHSSANTPEHFTYVHGLREASDSLDATAARLTVCGHVHDPALYHIAVTGKVMRLHPDRGYARSRCRHSAGGSPSWARSDSRATAIRPPPTVSSIPPPTRSPTFACRTTSIPPPPRSATPDCPNTVAATGEGTLNDGDAPSRVRTQDRRLRHRPAGPSGRHGDLLRGHPPRS